MNTSESLMKKAIGKCIELSEEVANHLMNLSVTKELEQVRITADKDTHAKRAYSKLKEVEDWLKAILKSYSKK